MPTLLVPLLLGLFAGPAPPGPAAATPKVLIIGVDGLRPDALLAADTPHLDRLAREGASSFDARTANVTLSGPAWTTLLTGVEPDKHGVVDNAFEDSALDLWPTLFERVEARRPGTKLAAVVAWEPLDQHLVDPSVVGRRFVAWHDGEATRAAAIFVRYRGPTLTFVHLDRVDRAGHQHGYGPLIPEYVEAVEAADARVGRILAALRARQRRHADESWLVLVTTDHGGTGRGHHEGTPTDRRTFVIAHGPGYAGGRTLDAPRIVDVAPTALRHLGIPVDPRWGLDGRPLRNIGDARDVDVATREASAAD